MVDRSSFARPANLADVIKQISVVLEGLKPPAASINPLLCRRLADYVRMQITSKSTT